MIGSHWMGFFLIISIGLGNGLRNDSLFGIIFLPYWGVSNWRRSIIIFLSLMMRHDWIDNIS